MASGFVKWVKMELEHYASIFRCQVFHDGQSFQTIAECMTSTADHCQMMAAVGLDLAFLFDQNLFHKDIAQSIELYRTRLLGSIAKATADDDFVSLITSEPYEPFTDSANKDKAPKRIPKYFVTPSCNHFYQTILSFLVDLSPLISNALYTETIESVTNFFETYFRHMMDLCHDPQYSDKQQLFILANLTFLAHYVFPCVRSTLSSEKLLGTHTDSKQIYRFARPIPELDKMQTRLNAMRTIVFTAFFQRRSKRLASETYGFGPSCVSLHTPGSQIVERRKSVAAGSPLSGSSVFVDYSDDTYPMLDQSFTSDTMLRCIKDLHVLAVNIEEVLQEFQNVPDTMRPLDKTFVLQGVLDAFFADIMDGRWKMK